MRSWLSARSYRAKNNQTKQNRDRQAKAFQRLWLESLEERTLLSVFTVLNTADLGPSSLRQAITDANAALDAAIINFALDAGDPNHLYYQDDGIAAQVSASNVATTSAADDGLILDIDPDFAHSWWRIQAASNLPTLTHQIFIDGYSQAGASRNTSAVGKNAILRVELTGFAGSGSGLFVSIGGDGSHVAGLAINSWSVYGMRVDGADNVWIEGNYIGTDVSGTLARANGRGIQVQTGAVGTIIGTDGDGVSDGGEGNLISGNTLTGVRITDAGTDYSIVAGNLLGTTADGGSALSNGFNNVIVRNGSTHTRIGTDGDGVADDLERNVISASTLVGVNILDSSYNTLAGNYIGTDATGMLPLGNVLMGVQIWQNVGTATGNRIGVDSSHSNAAAERNVISANAHVQFAADGSVGGGGYDGISLFWATNTTIAGNYLGTDKTGLNPLGNAEAGVYDYQTQNTLIGTDADGVGDALERNLISGNLISGVTLDGSISAVVAGNYIGVDVTGVGALPNTGIGVRVVNGATNNIIGGNYVASPGVRGNVIAHNQGEGVSVQSGSVSTLIRGNSIHANAGLGIDLDGNGVTFGFPVITQINHSVSTDEVFGSLQADADTTYFLDFYANSAADPTGYGEGREFLGAIQVTTDGSGFASFNVTLPAAVQFATQFLTATATDPNGKTTEFSRAQFVYSLTVTPPTDQPAIERTNKPFTLGSFADASPAVSWTATVDWGDGSAASQFNPSTQGSLGIRDHTYVNDGVYAVTISVANELGGFGIATFQVTVATSPLVYTPAVNQTVVQTATGTFALGSFADASSAVSWTAIVNWGDGSAVEVIHPAGPGSLGSGDHSFANYGNHTVTVSLTNNLGNNDSGTFRILVTQVPGLVPPGSLDISFGTDGKVVTNFDNRSVAGSDVAIDAQGRIVVVGRHVIDDNQGSFYLARYLANGSLDTSFGSGGQVITPWGPARAGAEGVAIQADGKIVVVGYTTSNHSFASYAFAVARYNEDGTLDTNFGSGGQVTTDFAFNTYEYASDVALDSQNRIVVAGITSRGGAASFDFAAARYNSDGTLDSTFGGDGTVSTPFDGGGDHLANAVAIGAGDKVILAGSSGTSFNASFAIARFNEDGSLDISFDNDGRVKTNVGGYASELQAIAIDTEGKIVVGGIVADNKWGNLGPGSNLIYQESVLRREAVIARYNEDGSLDSTLDGDGSAVLDLGGLHDDIRDLVIDSSGRIIIGGFDLGFSGYYDLGPSTDVNKFAVARFTPDGERDLTFGNAGISTLYFAGNTRSAMTAISGLALDISGNIVAAGYHYNETIGRQDFALARFYGGTAPVHMPIFTSPTRFDVFDRQSAVTTVAAYDAIAPAQVMTYSITGGDDAARFSITPEGALAFQSMPSFTAPTDADGNNVYLVEMTAVGFGGQTNKQNIRIVVKPSTAGIIDNAFGDGGKAALASYVGARDVMVDSAGRIVVAGYGFNGNPDFGVARFNPDGTLDVTFATGGKVTDYGFGQANSVAIDSLGRILLAGRGNSFDFVLARYDDNGLLDGTFGVGGRVSTDMPGGSVNNARGILAGNGKIFVAGGISTSFVVARYDANGMLDNAFDFDGKVVTSVGGSQANANSLIDLGNDKLLVAGDNNSSAVLVQYNADGSLDSGFGTGGKVTSNLGFSTFRRVTAVRDAAGRILIAGIANNVSFVLARFLANGALDTTFGTAGKITLSLGFSSGNWVNLALDRDGKIVVVADGVANSRQFNVIARFNADGSIDNYYGANGKVAVYGFPQTQLTRFAFDADGKILIATRIESNLGNFGIVARFEGQSQNFFSPVFSTSSELYAAENTAVVATVAASDTDLPGQTLTYAIAGGADAAKFSITTGGVLTFNAPPSFATPTDVGLDNVYNVDITVDDGRGLSATQSFAVSVIEFGVTAPANQSAVEGSSTTFALGTFSDFLADAPWEATVDWGDGSPLDIFNPASPGSLGTRFHAFADDGIYTSTIFVRNSLGAVASATFQVTVSNVTPSNVQPALSAAYIPENDSVTLNGSFVDPGLLDTHTVSIQWGDGNTSTLSLAAGVLTFGPTAHQYRNNLFRDAPYTITVTVEDNDNAASSPATVQLVVANVAPDIQTGSLIPSASLIFENDTATLSGTVVDPGTLDSHVVDIDWGDGSPITTINLAAGVLNFSSAPHRYLNNPLPGVSGNYTIQVNVRDNDGLAIGPGLLVGSSTSAFLRFDSMSGDFSDAIMPTGYGGLAGIGGVVFAPAALGVPGGIYVSSTATNNILQYDAFTGAFVGELVPANYGGLAFHPGALALGPGDNLYIADSVRDVILEFDVRTSSFKTFIDETGGLIDPSGIAFGPDNNFYVSSRGSDKVLYYNLAGELIGTFVDGATNSLSRPGQLQFGPDGYLYVLSTNDSRILRFDASGNRVDNAGPFINVGGGPDEASSFAFGPGGDLFVGITSTGTIARYSGATGELLGAFVAPGAGGLADPLFVLFTPGNDFPSTPLTVNNVPPAITSLILSQSVIGEFDPPITLTGTFTDPGTLDAHTVVIDWGDGVVESLAALPAGVFSFNAEHQYADNGPALAGGQFTITVTVADDPEGESDTDFTTVTVDNRAPTVTLPGPATLVLNEPLEVVVVDASPVDQAAGFTFTIDWGDGSPIEEFSPPPDNGYGIFIPHAYKLGTFTAIVSATDKDGLTSAVATRVLTIAVALLRDNDTNLVVGSPIAGGTITVEDLGPDNTRVTVTNVEYAGGVYADYVEIFDTSQLDTVNVFSYANVDVYTTDTDDRVAVWVPEGDQNLFLGSGGSDVNANIGSTVNISVTGGTNTLNFSPTKFGVTFDVGLNQGQTQSLDSTDTHFVSINGTFQNIVGTKYGDALYAALPVYNTGTLTYGAGTSIASGFGPDRIFGTLATTATAQGAGSQFFQTLSPAAFDILNQVGTNGVLLGTFRSYVQMTGGNSYAQAGVLANLTLSGGGNQFVGGIDASTASLLASLIQGFGATQTASLLGGFNTTVSLTGGFNTATAGLFSNLSLAGGHNQFTEILDATSINLIQSVTEGFGAVNTATVLGGFNRTISLTGGFNTARAGLLANVELAGGNNTYIQSIDSGTANLVAALVEGFGVANTAIVLGGFNRTISLTGGFNIAQAGILSHLTLADGHNTYFGSLDPAAVNLVATVVNNFNTTSAAVTGGFGALNTAAVLGGFNTTVSLTGGFNTAQAGVLSTINLADGNNTYLGALDANTEALIAAVVGSFNTVAMGVTGGFGAIATAQVLGGFNTTVSLTGGFNHAQAGLLTQLTLAGGNNTYLETLETTAANLVATVVTEFNTIARNVTGGFSAANTAALLGGFNTTVSLTGGYSRAQAGVLTTVTAQGGRNLFVGVMDPIAANLIASVVEGFNTVAAGLTGGFNAAATAALLGGFNTTVSLTGGFNTAAAGILANLSLSGGTNLFLHRVDANAATLVDEVVTGFNTVALGLTGGFGAANTATLLGGFNTTVALTGGFNLAQAGVLTQVTMDQGHNAFVGSLAPPRPTGGVDLTQVNLVRGVLGGFNTLAGLTGGFGAAATAQVLGGFNTTVSLTGGFNAIRSGILTLINQSGGGENSFLGTLDAASSSLVAGVTMDFNTVAQGVADGFSGAATAAVLGGFNTTVSLTGGFNLAQAGVLSELTITGGNNTFIGVVDTESADLVASIVETFNTVARNVTGGFGPANTAAVLGGFNTTVSLTGGFNRAQGAILSQITAEGGHNTYLGLIDEVAATLIDDVVRDFNTAQAVVTGGYSAISSATVLGGFNTIVVLNGGDNIAQAGLLHNLTANGGHNSYFEVLNEVDVELISSLIDGLSAADAVTILESLESIVVLTGGFNQARASILTQVTLDGGFSSILGGQDQPNEAVPTGVNAFASFGYFNPTLAYMTLDEHTAAVVREVVHEYTGVDAGLVLSALASTTAIGGDYNAAQAGLLVDLHFTGNYNVFIEQASQNQIDALNESLADAGPGGLAALAAAFGLSVEMDAGNNTIVGGLLGTFTTGPGNNRFVIQDPALLGVSGLDPSFLQFGGVFNTGAGVNTFTFVGQNFGRIAINQSPTADDVFDFSNVLGGAITMNFGLTAEQQAAAGLWLTLTSPTAVRRVVGNGAFNSFEAGAADLTVFGGAALDDRAAGAPVAVAPAQVVYLDFTTFATSDKHAYTGLEQEEILQRLEADFAPFNYQFTLVQPAAGDYTTVFFNDTPFINGVYQAGGLASEIDFRNLNHAAVVQIDVNDMLGGDGQPLANSANFVALSATIASHELGHTAGLLHGDSFGPIGFGIHNPPGQDGFLPSYPGLQAAWQTTSDIMASPASVGSTISDALLQPFFGERDAVKLAFIAGGAVENEESAAPGDHGSVGSAQLVNLLPLATFNTITRGYGAGKLFSAAAVDLLGSINIDPSTSQAEFDFYAFEGRAGDLLNIEAFSYSLTRISDKVDVVLSLYDDTGSLVPYYGGFAVSDDSFETADASLLDLILPEDGTYYIKIGAYSPTDTGSYELLIYRFVAGSAIPLGGSSDVFVAGPGQSTFIGRGGHDLVRADGSASYVLTDATLVGGGIANLHQIHNAVLTGVAGGSVFDVSGWTGSATLIGVDGLNTVLVNRDADFTLAGNVLTLSSGGVFTMSGIQRLVMTGGSSSNVFDLTEWLGDVQAEVAGGVGDVLVGPSTDGIWTITGTDTGNVNGVLSFSSISTVRGGAGNDTVQFATGAILSGDFDGGAGVNAFDYSSYAGAVTVNLKMSSATGIGGSFANIGALTGNATTSLVGADAPVTWNITGPNSGEAAGMTFSSVASLEGGTGADVFHFASGGNLSGTLDGGTGGDTLDYSSYVGAVTVNRQSTIATGVSGGFSNIASVMGNPVTRLIGLDAGGTWNITGGDSGNVGGLTFISVQNLSGGTGGDTFKFASGGSVSGTIDGGTGGDTLDYSTYAGAVSINLLTNSATALVGAFSNINSFIGAAASTLTGTNANTNWSLLGANSGVVGGISYASFQNLKGGSGNDNFVFATGGSVAGSIDGGPGDNLLDYSIYVGAVAVNLQSGQATGVGGSVGNFTNVIYNNRRTLVGGNTQNTWVINGANSVTLNGVSYTGVGSLVGGSSSDTFRFLPGGTLTDTIDGGAGGNVLDYSAYSDTVSVNFQSMRATGLGTTFANLGVLVGNSSTTLIGANTANSWTVALTNSGLLNSTFLFFSVQNLVGGAASDSFSITNSGELTGRLDGAGGGNTLSFASTSNAALVNLQSLTATKIGSFMNITALVGSTAAGDTLIGANSANTWFVSGLNQGDVNSVQFTGFESLTGGALDDVFTFAAGQRVTGKIDGAGGIDRLNLAAYTTAVAINLQSLTATGTGGIANLEAVTGGASTSDSLIGGNVVAAWSLTSVNAGSVNGFAFTSVENLTGGTNADAFTLSSGAGLFGILNGGGGTDTLVGASTSSTWNVTNSDAGNVNGMSFVAVEKLTGGSATDLFALSAGKGVTGSINGGGGENTLSYALYTTPVTVNLATGSATGIVGGVSNLQNVTGGSANDILLGNGLRNLLVGGGGSNILVGNDGNDVLTGGALQDLLIGGRGADTIYGGGGDDLLIGGYTSHDGNITSLIALLNEWKSTSSYDLRIAHLTGTTKNGLNGTVLLKASTVFDDGVADTLAGDAGRDWFFAKLANDLISDRNNGGVEKVFPLP